MFVFPIRCSRSLPGHQPKNIIFVCKQQRTSLSLPHPTPPMNTHSLSSTEEHHPCLQATTNIIIPAPPHPTHAHTELIIHRRTSSLFASNNEHHHPRPIPPHPCTHRAHHPPKNIIFVCKQQRTSLSLPHPSPPMITHFIIHRRTSSLFASNNEHHYPCPTPPMIKPLKVGSVITPLAKS